MVRKWTYGALAIMGFIGLLLIDVTMVVPFSSNPTITSALVLVFYLYLLYLIVFRRIY
ncbi:hypothetical protein [Thalassobacillus hwangdonensis]|uniref:Uncharacterized protein n=1 Tax=Thalassobacillus hwangdonensis TaxID=546108 RepID=A0ABW3L4F3_9BACI